MFTVSGANLASFAKLEIAVRFIVFDILQPADRQLDVRQRSALDALRTSLAIDSISAIVSLSARLRASELAFSWARPFRGAARVQHVVELLHGGVAFFVAEREDVLQGEADMRQIFFDIGAPVIFLVQVRARGADNARAAARIAAAPV